jgi:hypothetical protein
MTHRILITLDDAEDLDLIIEAVTARAENYKTAATEAAGSTTAARRSKADYRTQALRITETLEQAARLLDCAAAVRAAERGYTIDELRSMLALEYARTDLDHFESIDDLPPDSDDPNDPESQVADEAAVFLDPPEVDAALEQPAAALAAVPEPEPDIEDLPIDPPAVATAKAIRTARRRGALAKLPPLPEEDADGVAKGAE